jgi:hypothetical protein
VNDKVLLKNMGWELWNSKDTKGHTWLKLVVEMETICLMI